MTADRLASNLSYFPANFFRLPASIVYRDLHLSQRQATSLLMSNILDSCRDLPEKRFEEGEIIIHEAVRDGCLYILKEGSVEILKKEVRINTVSSKGVILGEVSFLLDRPHITSVRALESCLLYVCDDPLKFLTKHPEMNLYIARMLANRLSAVTDYLVELTDQVDAGEGERGVADAVLKSIMQHYSNKSL